MNDYVYLITVEGEGNGTYVAVCPGGLPEVGHYAILDNGVEGKVSHVIFIAEDGEEYKLIAAVAPIFQVVEFWALSWSREAPHADP